MACSAVGRLQHESGTSRRPVDGLPAYGVHLRRRRETVLRETGDGAGSVGGKRHGLLLRRLCSPARRQEIAVVSSTSLLAPRAEAAIRDVFSESDSASIDSSNAALPKAMLTPPMAGTESKPQTTTDEDGEEPVSGMNTKLLQLMKPGTLLCMRR